MFRPAVFLLLACCVIAEEHPPSFEVASVKPTRHGRDADGLSISDDPAIPSPGAFTATNNSLLALIRWAYRVKAYQVYGPAWLNDDSVRTLLEDRFRLALRRETRTLPVYELVAAKGAAKLRAADPDAKRGIAYEGKLWSAITSENTSSAEFASFLSGRLGRPVIDKTGIGTRFAVHPKYRINDDDPVRPGLFAALQEALGLSLNAVKATVEMLVIDRGQDRAPVYWTVHVPVCCHPVSRFRVSRVRW